METVSIPQMILAGQRDLEWFDSTISQLISRYNNKFIAFHDQKVLESDPDLDSLMRKLKKKNIDTSGVLVKFVSRVKAIL